MLYLAGMSGVLAFQARVKSCPTDGYCRMQATQFGYMIEQRDAAFRGAQRIGSMPAAQP
jgi:hypothetical protein